MPFAEIAHEPRGESGFSSHLRTMEYRRTVSCSPNVTSPCLGGVTVFR